MRVKLPFIFGLLFFSLQLQALEARPFDAKYKVYLGEHYIADSRFSLKNIQGEWIWRIDTHARGIYKLFTHKKPYIETRMQVIDQALKLLLEYSGDYPSKPPKQSSWFDYTGKLIYSMQGDNIKTLKLPDKIYNFHSIHLLYPEMLKQGIDEMTVDFFKKGTLLKTTLKLEKNVPVSNRGKTIIADKVTQTFEGSNKYFIYYYSPDTLAPLIIEQIKPGKEKTVMRRVWKA